PLLSKGLAQIACQSSGSQMGNAGLNGNNKEIGVTWHSGGLIAATKRFFKNTKDDVPISDMSDADQELMYHKLVAAVSFNVLPRLFEKVVEEINSGHTITIGPCILSNSGFAFRTGTVFRHDHLLTWANCDTQLQHGQMTVFSKSDHKIQISMSIVETDNAVLVPFIIDCMKK
ncbi:MAG: hypothetical protein O3A29_19900, partial [Planctomycetota bacterium]|nr:hypothetical protein [Planctomycetota bacterium]